MGTRNWKSVFLDSKGLSAIAVMAAIGLIVSGYLTVVHYSDVPLVCNTGGIVNCASVTSSPYSLLPGTRIPITFAGILWFVVSGTLASIGLANILNSRVEPLWLRPVQALWGLLGLVVILGLVYVEIVLLHSICEWCTIVHILTVLTFLISLGRLVGYENTSEKR